MNPVCLYNANDATRHSPLIGYAFDGYPVYGPFGYSDPNNAGSAIKRITSSYKTRSITARTTLADGTVLSSNLYGPAISAR